MLHKLSKRLFSTESAQNPLNIVQTLQSYQKALEFAHDEKYEKSLEMLQKTKKEIDERIGKNTNMHLFI